MPKRGSKRSEESIRKQREWWKVPEHRAQAKQKALETWAEKKIQGLPDQRENYAGYQAGYQKLWREKHKGYYTWKRQIRLGLIDPSTSYEDWVKDYVPRNKTQTVEKDYK